MTYFANDEDKSEEITAKDVFALRKQGQFAQAYRYGKTLISTPTGKQDPWNRRAYAWSLISLIKQESKNSNSAILKSLLSELRVLEPDKEDEVLQKQKEYWLHRFSNVGALSHKAYLLGQDGRYVEQIAIYEQIMASEEANADDGNGLGWAYYQASKELLSKKPINYVLIKEYLNRYLNLNLPSPSLLHTCILRIAKALSKEGQLAMSPFLHRWGINNFLTEDYEPVTTKDGRVVMSTVEQVVLAAAKNAVERERTNEQKFYLKELQRLLLKFPDNIWFAWRSIGLLMGLGEEDEAWNKAIEFTREKPNEYWTWSCLGDIACKRIPERAIGFYAKALCLSSDLSFVSPVKLKFANELAKSRFYGKARYEVDTVITYYESQGFKTPSEAKLLQSANWYEQTESEKVDRSFYFELAENASEVLYENLPWVNAVLGRSYSKDEKSSQKKRKLYVAGNPFAVQMSVNESLIGLKNKGIGTLISIKYEIRHGRAQVFEVKERNGSDGDIFSTVVGVISNLNHEKKMASYVVDSTLHGAIPFSNLPGKVKVGQMLDLQIAEYTSKTGRHFEVFNAELTDKEPENLIREFEGEYEQAFGNFGFVSDVFITPDLIQEHNLEQDCEVRGVAILSYNPKRSECGWKAIRLERIDSENNGSNTINLDEVDDVTFLI